MEQPNPYTPPQEVTPVVSPARWIVHPTVLFCAAFYTLAALYGGRSAFVEERTLSSLVLDIALALTLGLWATQDAKLRGKPIPRSQQFWFLIFAIIVVPCYVILTRGWKGLGWVMLHVLGWLVTTVVAMNVMGTLLYGAEWWLEAP
jgi:uncharacterized membrane protein YqaE (UPF0057 family)